jgi:hypothetical protein
VNKAPRGMQRDIKTKVTMLAAWPQVQIKVLAAKQLRGPRCGLGAGGDCLFLQQACGGFHGEGQGPAVNTQ